jgi:hypothetical protein
MSSLSPSASPRDTDFQTLLAQVRVAKAKRLLQRGVAAGSVAIVGVQGLAACSDEAYEPPEDKAVGPNVPVPGVDPGKSDWAQYEGERRTDMVQYRGDYFTETSDCNTRAGCMGLDIILKVFVKQQAGANLDAKRIGVVFRFPDWEPGQTETAMGTFHAAGNDGWEEWHVRIRVRRWQTTGTPIPVFNAWYQDGLNHTYYDDNAGEFHVAAAQSPINHYPAWDGVKIDAAGVKGTLGVEIADLDYDKQVELVWTTDRWQTVSYFGLGEGANKWRWVEDRWGGKDWFEINVDIPGSTDSFEYAVVYRHGVVNDARTYEFWANGGGSNYVVTP